MESPGIFLLAVIARVFGIPHKQSYMMTPALQVFRLTIKILRLSKNWQRRVDYPKKHLKSRMNLFNNINANRKKKKKKKKRSEDPQENN